MAAAAAERGGGTLIRFSEKPHLLLLLLLPPPLYGSIAKRGAGQDRGDKFANRVVKKETYGTRFVHLLSLFRPIPDRERPVLKQGLDDTDSTERRS